MAFCNVKYSPLTLISKVSSNICSLLSLAGANFAMPALANSASILPNFAETWLNNRSRSASLETSAFTASVPLPMVWTASSNVFWSRPDMATFAPSSLNSLAVASPMPLLPPVINAVFPSNRLLIRLLQEEFAANLPAAQCFLFQWFDEYQTITVQFL